MWPFIGKFADPWPGSKSPRHHFARGTPMGKCVIDDLWKFWLSK